MCATFWLWCTALRSPRAAVPFGVLAGLAYTYMVAAWGGYVFVLNMVGLHAGVRSAAQSSLRAEKYTKMPKNTPKYHKIAQIGIKGWMSRV